MRLEFMPPQYLDPEYQGPELAPAKLEGVEPGATGVEVRLEKAE